MWFFRRSIDKMDVWQRTRGNKISTLQRLDAMETGEYNTLMKEGKEKDVWESIHFLFSRVLYTWNKFRKFTLTIELILLEYRYFLFHFTVSVERDHEAKKIVIYYPRNRWVFPPTMGDEVLSTLVGLNYSPQISVSMSGDGRHVGGKLCWSTNFPKFLKIAANTWANKKPSFRYIRLTSILQLLEEGIHPSSALEFSRKELATIKAIGNPTNKRKYHWW